MESKVARSTRAGQIPDPVDGILDGIIEIVDDGDSVTFVQELKNRVGTNKTCPTSD